MPIIELQRRLREAGRIRIGEKAATSSGKTRPAKLDRFRFTSSDKASLEAIAAAYGGAVDVWDGAPVGIQFELYAETTAIDVIVPPVDLAFSQFMELWSGGGCVRRCDGQTNLMTDKPCVCDPDSPECKPTTRLGVIITAIQGIGMWRLETHGWNSASELNGAIEILRVVQNGGRMIPARLMLEQRQSKKDGKTFNYAVPVLDLNLSSAALTSASARHAELMESPISHVTPIDASRDALPSIAEQAAGVTVVTEKPRRANSAAPLPPTGIKPPSRRAEPIDATVVDEPSEPPKSKKPPASKAADKTDGGASMRSFKRLMAILNGKPEFKGNDEARHSWARKVLDWPDGAEMSFKILSQDEISKLSDAAQQPEMSEATTGYGHSEEPF